MQICAKNLTFIRYFLFFVTLLGMSEAIRRSLRAFWTLCQPCHISEVLFRMGEHPFFVPGHFFHAKPSPEAFRHLL